jgi:hypothetical protein
MVLGASKKPWREAASLILSIRGQQATPIIDRSDIFLFLQLFISLYCYCSNIYCVSWFVSVHWYMLPLLNPHGTASLITRKRVYKPLTDLFCVSYPYWSIRIRNSQFTSMVIW